MQPLKFSRTDPSRLQDDAVDGRETSSDDSARHQRQCELCESDRATTTKYGMQVCPPCVQKYLP